MRSLLFLVACIIAYTQSVQRGKCPDKDGPFPVYYIDPTNCSQFYECSNGFPVHQVCPPGLVFNNKSNVCVKTEDGNCVPEESLEIRRIKNPYPYKLDSIKNPVARCPEKDGAHPVYIPDDSDCQKYYECSHGIAKLFVCPPGLLFNLDLHVCDFPGKVKCNATEKTLIENGPTLADQCPEKDGEYPTYVLHPYNCALYYECVNGMAILLDCPKDLVFNPEELVCDYPERVNCTRSDVPIVPPSDDCNSNENGYSCSNTEPTLDTQCPAKDCLYPTFLLDPTNCHYYYMCAYGVPYFKTCPDNLAFNPKTLSCDSPKNVNCSTKLDSISVEDDSDYSDFFNDYSSEEDESSGEEDEDEENGEEHAEEDDVKTSLGCSDSGPTLDTKCPEIDCKYPTFLADPDDCHKYYLCSHGVPYPNVCEGDLEFNRKTLTCDFPQNVNCNTTHKKENKKSNTENGNTKNDGPSLAKKCPKKDGAWPVYLINKKDPSTFYECSNGVPVLQKCPKGLKFDGKILSCDTAGTPKL